MKAKVAAASAATRMLILSDMRGSFRFWTPNRPLLNRRTKEWAADKLPHAHQRTAIMQRSAAKFTL
jgi:hypothetical protein